MTDIRRDFDGVICFGGEDWWYHNRGHYDMQMMRELAADVPVLYVNSLGMRMPSVQEGRMFVRRVGRKLRSLARGCQAVRENTWVFSPFHVPRWRREPWMRALTARQVMLAANRCGIRRPLLWICCPTAGLLLERIPHVHLVYQRTDRMEAFEGVNAREIVTLDRALKGRADVTLFCSRMLFHQERNDCRRAAFVDHGVDYERFDCADRERRTPEDVQTIARPRIGFVGSIDAHTFDPPLFRRVAELLPDHQFVMVGGCSLPEGWCDLPNVHFLGQRPYDAVPHYMAACDVLIMPWNDSEWIKACNPVKMKEYLAVGRPVVSTPFDEVGHYPEIRHVCRDAESFAAAVRMAASQMHDPEPGKRRVAQATWAAHARKVQRLLEEPPPDLSVREMFRRWRKSRIRTPSGRWLLAR